MENLPIEILYLIILELEGRSFYSFCQIMNTTVQEITNDEYFLLKYYKKYPNQKYDIDLNPLSDDFDPEDPYPRFYFAKFTKFFNQSTLNILYKNQYVRNLTPLIPMLLKYGAVDPAKDSLTYLASREDDRAEMVKIILKFSTKEQLDDGDALAALCECFLRGRYHIFDAILSSEKIEIDLFALLRTIYYDFENDRPDGAETFILRLKVDGRCDPENPIVKILFEKVTNV